jgi:hypothetical protein
MGFQGEFQLAVEKLKLRSKALDKLIEWLQAGPITEGIPEQWILDKIDELLGGTDASLQDFLSPENDEELSDMPDFFWRGIWVPMKVVRKELLKQRNSS